MSVVAWIFLVSGVFLALFLAVVALNIVAFVRLVRRLLGGFIRTR